MHQLTVGGGGRSVYHYYRQPVDRTITFGPAMATPTFISVSPAPYFRVRAELTTQSTYGSSVYFHLTPNGAQLITMSATKEYFGGTPSVWSLTIPDLSKTNGFKTSWAPAPGPFGSSVFVFDQRSDFYVTGPRDGETIHWAHRSTPSPPNP